MIVDIIKKLNIKVAESQECIRIQHKIYAAYDGSLIFVAHPYVAHKYHDSEVVLDNHFIYAFECKLEDLKEENICVKISEAINTKTVYHSFWRNQKEIESEYSICERGFCLIHEENGMLERNQDIRLLKPDVMYNDVKRYIQYEKEKLDFINVPTFKQTLVEWMERVGELRPTSPYEINRKYEWANNVLHFINDMDYLLLSNDPEVRELYIRKIGISAGIAVSHLANR